MLTETEVDALAREILTQVITELSNWSTPLLHDLRETESGELIPVSGGTSTDGYGSFLCEYMPLDAIRKVIDQCVVSLNSLSVKLVDTESGESREVKPGERMSPETRVLTIRKMAEYTSLIMIASFRRRLQDTLAEAVRDSDLISQTILGSFVGEMFNEVFEGHGKMTGDITVEIEDAARRVADYKREFLRSQVRDFPHVLAERRRGGSNPRVEVSDETCVRMADAYPRLLKHWKKVAKNRRSEQNWRAYAKVDEPSTPDDLLDRVDDLPQEGDSASADYPNIPSALAHEHAARISGIRANEYSLSSLKLLRRRGDSILGQAKTSD